jgi:signal peptidase II
MLKVSKVLPLAVVLLLVGCDHGTKHLAKAHLEGKSALELVPGVFDLRYTENTDTAFSLLGSWVGPHVRQPLLVGVKLAVVSALVAFLLARWSRLRNVERAGALMALAGGFGNLIDRFARGYVIDFLHLRHWPVFNVADIVITIGVALLLLGRRAPTKRWRAPSNAGTVRA